MRGTVPLAVVGLLTLGAAGKPLPPFHVFNEKSSVITFHRPEDLTRYIGYRIVEDDPVVAAEPVAGYDRMPARRGEYPPPPLPAQAFPTADIPRPDVYAETWQSSYEDKTYFYRTGVDGTTWFKYTDPTGTRVSVFKPVEDGLDAWMWLEPAKDIAGAHIVQQCLRMSGIGNTFKRRQSAFVPELSEYDLWDKREARGLSYTRVADAWKSIAPLLAVVQQTEFKNAWEYISDRSVKPGYVKTLFYTPPGAALAEKGGARVAAERRVDNGLLARESVDGKTVAGMYWERTAQVTTHHPADCLHAMVDLGPTTAAKPLVVRGKVYWFKGTKDDLLARWKRDFPG